MRKIAAIVPHLWKISAVVLVAALIIIRGQAPITAAQAVTETPTSDTAGMPPTFEIATPTPVLESWQGTKRFTILVMGLDKRPMDTGTAFHTDTMLLVSIDPTTDSLGVLSIPRDLYVPIPPGATSDRINDAYFTGEVMKAGYGPQLAMQTVQYNFGMPIDSYVVFDFEAVEFAVDAIGGIDIDVPTAISDPTYPDMNNGYQPLYIPAGHVHMDGTLALEYARTRHGSNDIERTLRQQQIIFAMRDKIESQNMLTSLAVRAPVLWLQMSHNVHSGLPISELVKLAVYVKNIPQQNVHEGVIDFKDVSSAVIAGADVLIPNQAVISGVMATVFGADYNKQ